MEYHYFMFILHLEQKLVSTKTALFYPYDRKLIGTAREREREREKSTHASYILIMWFKV